MNKETFYTQFRRALADLGCDDSLIGEWVEAASEYISLIPDSEFSKKFDGNTVNRLIDRMIASPETALEEIFRGAPRSVTPLARPSSYKQPEPDPEPVADVDLPVDDVPASGVLDAVFADEPESADDDGFTEDEIPVSINVPDETGMGDTQIFDVNEADDLVVVDREKLKRAARERKLAERRYVKGSPLFYFLLIVLFPVWGVLYGAVWIAVGALFLAVALLIAAFIISMVAIVGAGTALSLVGIIYGIVQLFKQMPIGLFEIGIGIALAGTTMLVSILLYNVAVRLAPKLFKPLKKLASAVYEKLGDLYYNAKKECAKK